LIGAKEYLAIKKGNVELVFDIVIRIQKGKLFCINIQRNGETSCSVIEISKNRAHELLEHSNSEANVALAKRLG